MPWTPPLYVRSNDPRVAHLCQPKPEWQLNLDNEILVKEAWKPFRTVNITGESGKHGILVQGDNATIKANPCHALLGCQAVIIQPPAISMVLAINKR
jgi:hypothetical protein